MSKVFKRGPKTPEMNMTPLIDVTFLLIIFFMIVSNIVSEQAVQMLVPDLEDPKTRKLDEEVRKIVVNLAPVAAASDREENPLAASGLIDYVLVNNVQFVPSDTEGISNQIKSIVEKGPKDQEDKSELEVLLRADSALYYEEVQPVMAAITGAGIGTINLVALLPEDQR